MAASLSANKYNRKNWEQSDFPILCETCLGENPYVRMMKDKYGAECKVCARPFTVFRWCPGQGMRYKRTDICQTCAKLKNCCQTCIFDLEFGVPLQLRDKILGEATAKSGMLDQPKSELNREFFMQQLGTGADDIQKQLANPEGKGLGDPAIEAAKEKLRKLGRQGPYYKRNAAKLCTFWAKGMCKRGEECPYRHEKPTDPDDPLSRQNRSDRYFGTNDPVADKLWERVTKMPDQLKPPNDKTITTLFVKGVTPNVGDSDLNSYFYQYGPITSISIVDKKAIAFVQFERRQDAERAMQAIHGQAILVAGENITVRWGKKKKDNEFGNKIEDYVSVPGLPGSLPEMNPETGEVHHLKALDGEKRLKGVAIAPPTLLNVGQINPGQVGADVSGIRASDADKAAGGGKIKGKKKGKIGGQLPAVSMTGVGVHYPSQNPDRMGGYID